MRRRACRPPNCSSRSACLVTRRRFSHGPLDEMRVVASPPAVAMRQYRSPHTVFPHAQFLSNGNYATIVTNGGGGASFWHGLAVTKSRRDADAGSGQSVRLPARRAKRSRVVGRLSSDGRGTGRVHRRVPAGAGDVPPARRPDRHATRRRRLHGRRRRSATRDRSSTRAREFARSTSPATRRSCWRRRPMIWRTRRSASCFSKPNTSPTAPRCSAIGARAIPGTRRSWAMHVLSLEGRSQGPVEWETDRARFIGRGRDTNRPAALDGSALSGTTGVVLDPVFSLRQRIRLVAGASVRLSFAHRHCLRSRHRPGARAEVPGSERRVTHVCARVHERAERTSSPGHFTR